MYFGKSVGDAAEVKGERDQDLRCHRAVADAGAIGDESTNDHLETKTQDWDGNLEAKKQPYKLPFLSELFEIES